MYNVTLNMLLYNTLIYTLTINTLNYNTYNVYAVRQELSYINKNNC